LQQLSQLQVVSLLRHSVHHQSLTIPYA
jgi:hypothetical protein